MKKIGFFLLSFIITVIIIEIFFRKAEISPPFLSQYDEKFGLVNTPDLDYIKFKEGFFIGTSNEHGRYGDNYTLDKPSNTIRIVFVGDSYVEGLDVFSKDHFVRIIEKKLNNSFKNKKIEALNFGRGNLSLALSYFYYKNFILQFNPDIVIYFMERRDYVMESNFSGLANLTHYVYNDSSLVPVESWKNSETHKLLSYLDKNNIPYNKVSLIALSKRALDMIKVKSLNYFLFGKFRIGSYNLDLSTDQSCTGLDVKYNELSEGTKFIIDELASFDKENRMPKVYFVIRSYPCDASKLKNYFEEKKYTYFELNDIFDDQIIKSNGKDGGHFKATNSYGGHFNHYGHIAVGEYFAEKLKNIISNDEFTEE